MLTSYVTDTVRNANQQLTDMIILSAQDNDREHDLDLPHPREQRQALARRADGAALVRRRDGRVEAGKQFRRVNGHLHLRSLRDTLERVTQPVSAAAHTDTVTAA